MGLSRRDFLVGSGISGAGFLIGFGFEASAENNPALKTVHAATPIKIDSSELAGWVRIDSDETVTIYYAKSEMGQGVSTSLPQIVADELDADWMRVRAEVAPLDERFGSFSTAASASVQSSWEVLRQAGACARQMLIQAAAKIWQIPSSECETQIGFVHHRPSGRQLSYGTLAKAAAREALPAHFHLKASNSFHLIGKSVDRLDADACLNGSMVYSYDVNLDNMKHVTVLRCPYLEGELVSLDSKIAEATPGVLKVISLRDGSKRVNRVAVIAESSWAALQGRKALQVTWRGSSSLNSSQIETKTNLWLTSEKGLSAFKDPLPSENMSGTTPNNVREIQGQYQLPFLAHMTMEPMSCTARVHGSRCEIWTSTQHPELVVNSVASLLHTEPSQIKLNRLPLGGGFGRKLKEDYVLEAVEIARASGFLVKVAWTREDDIQRDYFRPLSIHRIHAKIDKNKRINSWHHKIAGQSSIQLARGAETLPYDLGAKHIEVVQKEGVFPVQTGPLRGISFPPNVFAIECFLDEIASIIETDPLDLRLRLLRKSKRHQEVLKLVAKLSHWNEKAKHRAKGLALSSMAGSVVAHVAEVFLEKGLLKVSRVWCAVDCGLVIHPDLMKAQITGGVLFGLSAVFGEEVTFSEGRVVQSSYSDYPILRAQDIPEIEVAHVPSFENPQGLGEVATPGIGAAVANATSILVGHRIRTLPIRAQHLKPSKDEELKK